MRVAIVLSEDGGLTVVTDSECIVYTIDENAPDDRVFRLENAHTVDAKALDQLIGNSEIGHAGDDKHAALEPKIRAALDGEPEPKLH